MNRQLPDESQVITSVPEHFVEVGMQVPVQAPPLQANGHVCVVCQKPLLLQIWALVPAHCAEDGVQETHVPLKQLGTKPEQVVPGIQFPVPSHDRGTFPEQSEVPGTHAVQPPARQEVEHA